MTHLTFRTAVQSRAAQMLFVAIAYGVAMWFSVSLPASPRIATPIWLPGGVALAAVLLGGRSMLAAIVAADLLGNVVLLGLPPPQAVALTAATALTIITTATLMSWLSGGTIHFGTVRCVVSLLIAAAVASSIGISVAVIGLALGADVPGNVQDDWVRSWLAGYSGMIIITPLIISWQRRGLQPPAPARLVEAIALGALLAATTSAVSYGGQWRLAELMLAMPLLTWAALRFGLPGATAAAAMFAVMTAWGTARAGVTLEGLDQLATIDVVQLVTTVVAASSIVIAAAYAERTAALERLHDIIDTFTLSQELVRVGSWELALDGTGLVWCSPELAQLLPISPDAEGRVPLEELVAAIPVPEREPFLSALRDARDRHGRFEHEHRLPRSTGPELVFTHVGTFVPRRSGDHADRLVGAVIDVTREREMEHFKDDLIATTSHELRTPLTSILGFADTLATRWDDVTETHRRSYVRIIDEQAHRLDLIVSDALLQSKLDSGTLRPDTHVFLVGRCVRNAIAAQPGADDITQDVAPGLMSIGDPLQLERTLENLLTNAKKYGRPPIVVRGQRIGDHVELRVDDHGRGVPSTFRARLFDRFARGPDVGNVSGTGLGLSISRGLVEAMGGTLTYERRDGVSSFVVRLPAA